MQLIHRWQLIACSMISVLAVVAAALPLSGGGGGWQYAILLPGFLVASLFWPEGAHSGGVLSGTIGIWLMFIVIYAGSAVTWSLLVYTLVSLFRRWRRPEGTGPA